MRSCSGRCPSSEPDRLVDIYTTSPDGDTYATSSYPDYLDFKAQSHVFSRHDRLQPDHRGGDGRRSLAAWRWAKSSPATTSRSSVFVRRSGARSCPTTIVRAPERAVLMSHRLWIRDYGSNPGIVGQSMRIHSQPYTIVGVAERSFTGMVPMLSAELWTPMAYVDDVEPGGIISIVPSPTGNTRLERRGTRWMFVKGRLKDGATVAQAAGEPAGRRQPADDGVSSDEQGSQGRRPAPTCTSIRADRTLLPIALGLMLVVGLVLLVACANVASMLLARASGRQKEIGIRLAIGASRGRLAPQLLTESLVMALLGAAAGIGLAWALTQVAIAIKLPIPIPARVRAADRRPRAAVHHRRHDAGGGRRRPRARAEGDAAESRQRAEGRFDRRQRRRPPLDAARRPGRRRRSR